MKKTTNIFLTGFIIIFLITGCGDSKNKTALQGGSLENSSWALVNFTRHNIEGAKITLNFEKEKMSGKAVCNNYFSSYNISGNTVSFEALGATRMMCENNAKLEMDYFNQFSKPNVFGVKNDKLILKNSNGILEFKIENAIKKSPVLNENSLGEIPLTLSYTELKKRSRIFFLESNIKRNRVNLEDGSYDEISMVSDGDTLKGILSEKTEQLKSLKIISDKIKDVYGVQSGMSFETLKILRPDIKIKTDTHFHTYAYVESSNIEYELCCNEIGPDKINWSVQEVNDWKIKSLNWQME